MLEGNLKILHESVRMSDFSLDERDLKTLLFDFIKEIAFLGGLRG
jgi:hypothetical protein